MAEVKINSLSLNIENAVGQEHRIQPIAVHAAARFAVRLEERLREWKRAPDSQNIEALSAEPLSLGLARMSDEQVADRIATAWLEVLASSLRL